jgi:transcriptional regulator with XRE-family HTH domain
MALAAKLKELRLRRGQSLQQLADAVGASKGHIWELESGKSSNPSLELLRKLADNFKISVASLIGETLDDMPPDIIRMYRDLDTLTDSERAVIEDVIEGMKKRRAQRGGNES